ncbi:hypothetical protein [Pontibaca salina]|uniref:Uncharacterized protein n=1 Tax=Pontibaca salina TaxID=2795731 RepID=A0A934HI83_9RHOB|nr:hypothetical protein [Pontibaca salina]MBI6628638.1 hypothetical protein [Pontibaca salina]
MSPEATRRRRRETVVHERQTYRRRRHRDAARLLAVLGTVLFAVPLLWERAGAEGGAVAMSSAIIYLFSAWAALIAISFWLGVTARHWEQDETGSTPNQDAETG